MIVWLNISSSRRNDFKNARKKSHNSKWIAVQVMRLYLKRRPEIRQVRVQNVNKNKHEKRMRNAPHHLFSPLHVLVCKKTKKINANISSAENAATEAALSPHLARPKFELGISCLVSIQSATGVDIDRMLFQLKSGKP
jgi:hypothetical protein